MNDLYTILINEDHSFTHTYKKRIMHRSSMIDTIRFLVKPVYGSYNTQLDMTKVNVALEYVTPISRKYGVIVLKPETELYKNRVQYLLPIDLKFTSEPGDLDLTINFSYLSINENGEFVEQVRPIGYTSLKIEATQNWSDYIASSDLDNLAQIMMTNQAIAEQNKVDIELMKDMMCADIKHDAGNNILHLVNESGVKIGAGVSVDGIVEDADLSEGIPSVDLDSETNLEENYIVDNVVEI